MNARETLIAAVDALEKMGFVILPRSEVEAKDKEIMELREALRGMPCPRPCKGAPTLTYAQFKALDPCEESRNRVVELLGGARTWGDNGVTAAQAKEAGCTLDDLVWAASALARRDKDVERRLRLWMADCAAHVLHIYEQLGTSEAPRNAIIANRRFARGEIDASARAAAMDAARAAAWAAAWDAEDAAARAAARAAAWDAEEAWQLDRLVAWMSDDEPDDWPLPDRAAPNETRGRNSDIGRADPARAALKEASYGE